MLCIINFPFYIPYKGTIPKYICTSTQTCISSNFSPAIPLLCCIEKLLKQLLTCTFSSSLLPNSLFHLSSTSLLSLALVKVTNDLHLAKSNDEYSVLIILVLSADLYVIDLSLLKTFILLSFSDATLFQICCYSFLVPLAAAPSSSNF